MTRGPVRRWRPALGSFRMLVEARAAVRTHSFLLAWRSRRPFLPNRRHAFSSRFPRDFKAEKVYIDLFLFDMALHRGCFWDVVPDEAVDTLRASGKVPHPPATSVVFVNKPRQGVSTAIQDAPGTSHERATHREVGFCDGRVQASTPAADQPAERLGHPIPDTG